MRKLLFIFTPKSPLAYILWEWTIILVTIILPYYPYTSIEDISSIDGQCFINNIRTYSLGGTINRDDYNRKKLKYKYIFIPVFNLK